MLDDFLLSSDSDSDSDSEDDDHLYSTSVEHFVEEFARPNFIFRAGARWCMSWQKHPQARITLEGLWRSYEGARASDMVNAGGNNTCAFLVNQFMPLMDALTRADGVFENCAPGSCAGPAVLGSQSLGTHQATAKPANLTFEGRVAALTENVLGQDEVIAKVARRLAITATGVRIQENRPAGVFLFTGPSGCGKTELAHVIAELEFGSREDIIRIDLAEYTHYSDVSRLTGSAPGYLGNDQPEGWLTTRIIKQPKCVLLLDEVEKAHKQIFDTLLGVFDAGRLTDGRDRTADFRDVVIILTSNLGGGEFSRKSAGFSAAVSRDDQVSAGVSAAVERHFRPEFLGRIDEVLQFKPLSVEVLESIVIKELEHTCDLLAEKGWDVKYADDSPQHIAVQAAGSPYGARLLHRIIEDTVLGEVVTQPKGVPIVVEVPAPFRATNSSNVQPPRKPAP